MSAIAKNRTIRFTGEKTVQVSRSFRNNANIYGTPEYHLWQKFRKSHPKVIMEVPKSKSKRKNTSKSKPCFKMRYKDMEEYISTLRNSEALMKEFNLIRKRSKIARNPYQFVLAWFNQQFENLNSYEDYFTQLKEQETAESEADEQEES